MQCTLGIKFWRICVQNFCHKNATILSNFIVVVVTCRCQKYKTVECCFGNKRMAYKSFSSSLSNLLHSPVTSSLPDPNILLNTMFSNTLSFLSSRNVSDQVSHPYKTTGKIIVLYILIFKFLDSNLEDKKFCTE